MSMQMRLFGALAVVAPVLLTTCAPDNSCEVDCNGNFTCNRVSATCVTTVNTVPNADGPQNLPQTGLPCDVQAVLQNNCASCHGAVPSGGAPMSLVTRGDLLAPSALNPSQNMAQRSIFRMTAKTSPMPPAIGPMVPEVQVHAFTNWVNAGSPIGSCNSTANPFATGAGGGGGTTQVGTGGSGGSGGSTGTGGSTGSGGSTGTGGSAGSGGSTGAGGGGGTTTSALYCKTCTTNADCGGSTSGNFCLDDGYGNGYCGTKCSTASACPSGASCVDIVNASNTVVGKDCVPSSGVCSGSSGTGGGGGTGGSGGAGGAGGTGGTGGAGGGSATCTDTWASYASGFFSSNCSSCHGSEFSYSYVSSNQTGIKSRISSGNMPPGGLSSTSKTKILNWFTCGLKQ